MYTPQLLLLLLLGKERREVRSERGGGRVSGETRSPREGGGPLGDKCVPTISTHHDHLHQGMLGYNRPLKE
mgnify:CR=1 FL=1